MKHLVQKSAGLSFRRIREGSACFKSLTVTSVAVLLFCISARGQSGSATFVNADSTTQGNWVNTYGNDGYIIATGANAPPSYATVSVNGAVTWLWSTTTTDSRAPYADRTQSNRIASTYDSDTVFSIDVNLTDGATHRLAVYCLDFDFYNRAQTISILDAASGSTLNTEQVTNFHGGVYEVWALKGHVIVQVTHQPDAGWNAVVAGLFFDTPAGAGSGSSGPWAANGSSIYYNGGNVGIGTSAPTADLQVQGKTFSTGGFFLNNNLSVLNGSPWYGLGQSTLNLYNVYPTATSTQLAGWTGLNLQTGAGQMVIRGDNGNVGIGTTTPQVKTEIANGGVAYNLYLSGYAPSLYFGGTPGVAPNGGAGQTAAGFMALATENGSYGVGKGDLLLVTQSWQAGNSNSIKFGMAVDDKGQYGLAMTILKNGNVGIGTPYPQHMLHVAGPIGATEVIVSSTGADYVFKPEYHLSRLTEVAAYIKKNGHLPDIPSEQEVRAKGLGLGDMQTKLLAKVEELTLRMIQMDEQNKQVNKDNKRLRERVEKLEKRSLGDKQ